MNSLEERIATALSEDIASADVATLITDTEAAISARSCRGGRAREGARSHRVP
jgi:hypothetical protein